MAALRVPGVFLDTSVLDRMTADMKPKGSKIVNTYGKAISGEWAMNVPVDTGAFKNGILSESHMEGELTYIVQDATGEDGGYGLFVELGTYKMAARPNLVPAVEHWTDRFLNAFGELFK